MKEERKKEKKGTKEGRKERKEGIRREGRKKGKLAYLPLVYYAPRIHELKTVNSTIGKLCTIAFI